LIEIELIFLMRPSISSNGSKLVVFPDFLGACFGNLGLPFALVSFQVATFFVAFLVF
jgi:hypothetical protein